MAAADAHDRFMAAANDLGVDVAAVRFGTETRTAVQAAEAIGCDVGQIVKSLVFATSEGPVLVLTSGANRVDTEALATMVGTRLDKADADTARAATGYSIGGTPPFGHPSPLPTYVDRALLGHQTVWAAAGSPDSVFPIAPARLVEVAAAVVGDFGQPVG